MKQALKLACLCGYIDQRIFARILEGNFASAAVLRSAGFLECEHVDGWVTYRKVIARSNDSCEMKTWLSEVK